MRKGTKITLAASALALVGAAGLSSMAIAEYRGSHGTYHHKASYGGHGWGHHRGGHHKRWHKAKRMERMMERFDVNEDGKLTQEEVNEARKALLTKFDADKDGKLNLSEFEQLWMDYMRQRMVRGFQRIDRDGDTAITLDEYLKPFSKIVERLDRNDDGVFDKQDRRKYGHRHHKHDGDSSSDKRGG